MSATQSHPSYPSASLFVRGLDLLFPPTCAGCKRVGRWICAECWSTVEWIRPLQCGNCGQYWTSSLCAACEGRQSNLDGLIAVAIFDGVAREAIHAFKFEGMHGMGTMLGKLMAASMPDLPIDLVVPVPLHSTRRRERGYDQSEILARVVARSLDLTCDPSALRRTRRTKQQAMLDAGARLRNVEGAFAASELVDGHGIVLVDDVTTTGATLESAATELLRAGAASVVGLVFAAA